MAVVVLASAAACGGEPPRSLAGFELGQTQEQVLEAARSRGGFDCRLRSSRPPLAVCEGPTEQGTVTVLVRGDSVVSVRLRIEPGDADDRPRAAIRRFVRPFGDPAWRDRPYPPRSLPPDRFHTQWIDGDSLRSLALICAHEDLGPPCTAELTATRPAAVEARRDTLLGIRR